MSQENVEIVRSLYERLNAADDFEAASEVAEEVFDPEIEFEISWRSGRDAADFRVLHGIEEVRTVIADLIAPFASFRWEIHESFDAGDEVVLILESLVTPNESAAEISTGRFGYVFTFATGRSPVSRTSPTRPMPSKPQGFRSRRCRRRRSRARSTRPQYTPAPRRGVLGGRSARFPKPRSRFESWLPC